MKNNETSQSSESTTDHRARTASSRSRRGFLKNAATVGILGMTGLTAVVASSEPARAGGWDRGPIELRGPGWLNSDHQKKFEARWTGEIRIEGVADHSDYSLSSPNLREAGNEGVGGGNLSGRVEPGDDLDHNSAYGEINDWARNSGGDEYGFVDDYFFEDYVWCTVDAGIIDVYINDTRW